MTDRQRWTIRYGGEEFTDEHVSAVVATACTVMVEDGWRSYEPWHSPVHLLSMLACLVAARRGVEPLEVYATLGATMHVDELRALLTMGGDAVVEAVEGTS